MKLTFYHYKARIMDVIDGDTVRANIDLGMHMMVYHERLRLFGINCPEATADKSAWEAGKEYLANLILNKWVLLETIRYQKRSGEVIEKKGGFGRYLAKLGLPTEKGLLYINDHMIEKAFAEPYER